MKQNVILIGIILPCILLLSGCAAKEQDKSTVTLAPEGSTISYDMATVTLGTVTKSESIKCTYRQVNEQEVTCPFSGKVINKVYVSEGDEVKPGDLLLSLQTDDLDERIDELNYLITKNQLLLSYNDEELKNEIEAREVQYTYHTEQTSEDWQQKEKDEAEIKKKYRYLREDYADELSVDQTELAALQSEKAQSQITSSLNGTITSIKKDLENSISKKDSVIMTVIDGSECLFETEAGDLVSYFKEGEPVTMSIISGDAAGDYQLLPYNMNQWDTVQTFEVKEQPENAVLDVGTSGEITIVLEQMENVLQIPASAVHTAEGKSYVYMSDEKGMREVVFVETGLYGNETVEIKSGLSEGDKVILK